VPPAARGAQRPESSSPDRTLAETSGKVAADSAASTRSELQAAQVSAAPPLAKARSVESGRAPLAELLAALAHQPDRWGWQRGGGAAQPMNPGLQRWLGELDRATASRWGAAGGRAPHGGPGALRLLRDGVAQATLGLDADVWVEFTGTAAPKSAVAALPQGAIETLRKTLDEATQ
jgi:hypothetical protein